VVIVIDDFAVDSNTVQPKAKPAVPPVTPLYDDNTMYNTTVYPGKQVSAPSAAEQPVVYQAPIWESATQTYRDPASGLLWLDDGTPGGQWVSDTAYAARKAPAPAPPPPVGQEDSYDFYSNPDWNTDSDAYWQTYNPGKVESLMTEWDWNLDSDRAQPIYGTERNEELRRRRGQNYTDMIIELSGQNIIEPISGADMQRDLGDQYNYSLPYRQEWNRSLVNSLPYTTSAKDFFVNDTPEFLGTEVPFNYGSIVRPKYGGYAGNGWTAATVSPNTFLHERGHQWDAATGKGSVDAPPPREPVNYLPDGRPAPPAQGPLGTVARNEEFVNTVLAVMSNPDTPQWLYDSLQSGYRWGSEQNNLAGEIYAELVEAAAYRWEEIPPELRKYLGDLYYGSWQNTQNLAPSIYAGNSMQGMISNYKPPLP